MPARRCIEGLLQCYPKVLSACSLDGIVVPPLL
jgi:hypothetical protein